MSLEPKAWFLSAAALRELASPVGAAHPDVIFYLLENDQGESFWGQALAQ